MEVIFKSLELEELEKTIDLCNLCFNENTDYEYAKEVFLETRNDPNSIYINGICDGEVIAHAKITIIKTMYKPMETYAILNHVCVNPNLRRHHIATHLLDVMFKICKDRGCNKVELWSMNFREAAHACYKRYGFKLEEAGFFSKEVE
ncbi:MAG: GNAT family N-acetyltransferase [Ruminococcus sp.]|nr:GNAT family N-acetyltransferase [Ruminococcus sp.]